MKLISWNVNGLRACLGKGFLDFCAVADADIICLQETKMRPEQAEFDLPGYHRYWNSADKAGYSGTAVFTRRQPLSVRNGATTRIDSALGSTPSCRATRSIVHSDMSVLPQPVPALTRPVPPAATKPRTARSCASTGSIIDSPNPLVSPNGHLANVVLVLR